MCRVGSAVWRRAALCAVWAAPCGAVRRRADAVPCGHRRAAPCGTMLCRAAPCSPCVPCGNAARRVARARRVACRVACRVDSFPWEMSYKGLRAYVLRGLRAGA
eukprot:gene11515-biopygen5316